jgi:hypothetical protein
MLIDNLLNSFHSKPFWKQDYKIVDNIKNKKYKLTLIINIVKTRIIDNQYTYHLKMRMELFSSGGRRTSLETVGINNGIIVLSEINEVLQNVLIKYNDEKETQEEIAIVYEDEINKYVIEPVELNGFKISKI